MAGPVLPFLTCQHPRHLNRIGTRGSSKVAKKEFGSTFKPWMQFRRFSIIPNWLLRQKQITPGAKLCFARLLQYCGKHDYAFPRIEKLAL